MLFGPHSGQLCYPNMFYVGISFNNALHAIRFDLTAKVLFLYSNNQFGRGCYNFFINSMYSSILDQSYEVSDANIESIIKNIKFSDDIRNYAIILALNSVQNDKIFKANFVDDSVPIYVLQYSSSDNEQMFKVLFNFIFRKETYTEFLFLIPII